MTATPRNLDPKFKDAKPSDEGRPADENEPVPTDANMTESDQEDEGSYISNKRTWVDNEGKTQERVDRMRIEDFPAYQKKWGI